MSGTGPITRDQWAQYYGESPQVSYTPVNGQSNTNQNAGSSLLGALAAEGVRSGLSSGASGAASGAGASAMTPVAETGLMTAADGAGWGALGADAAATSAGSNTGMMAGLPAFAPWAGVAGIGAYTAAQAYNAMKNAEGQGLVGGFKQGVRDAGFLNFVPVLGQAPWIAGALGGEFGTGKDRDQIERDKVRSILQDLGTGDQATGSFKPFLGDDYNVTLSNGMRLDLGVDGGHRYADGSAVWSLPWDTDAKVGQGVGWLQPIAWVIGGSNENKAATDVLIQQMYNALNADNPDINTLRARIADVYIQLGMTPSIAHQAIEQSPDLTPEQKAAAHASIDSLKPGGGPQDLSQPVGGQQPAQAGQPAQQSILQPPPAQPGQPAPKPKDPMPVRGQQQQPGAVQPPRPSVAQQVIRPRNLNEAAQMMGPRPQQQQPKPAPKVQPTQIRGVWPMRREDKQRA